MSSVKIKQQILKAIQGKVLTSKDTGGHRTFADLACDVVNNSGKSDKELSGITDLSQSTVKRIRENISPYNPNTRTIEKILIAHGFSMELR